MRWIALMSLVLIASCSSQSEKATRDSTDAVISSLSPTTTSSACILPDLNGCNLFGRDFSGAYLRQAQMANTDLRGANLPCANLSHANLRGANLTEVVLSGANLTNADLSGAFLSLANLRDAILTGANLADVKGYASVNLKGATMPDGTIYP